RELEVSIILPGDCADHRRLVGRREGEDVVVERRRALELARLAPFGHLPREVLIRIEGEGDRDVLRRIGGPGAAQPGRDPTGGQRGPFGGRGAGVRRRTGRARRLRLRRDRRRRLVGGRRGRRWLNRRVRGQRGEELRREVVSRLEGDDLLEDGGRGIV